MNLEDTILAYLDVPEASEDSELAMTLRQYLDDNPMWTSWSDMVDNDEPMPDEDEL